MSNKRWVVVSSLGLCVAVSCAEAEDQGPNDADDSSDNGGSGSGGSAAGHAGKATSGSSNTSGSSQGGKAGSTSSGGKSGSSTGGASHAGTATGGSSHAGTATGGSSTAGSAGTNAGGTGSTALGCLVEASGGAGAEEGGAANAGAAQGGAASAAAGDTSTAGAPTGSGGADTGALPLFFDDFESGSAERFTTSLGNWAVVDDGSKVYEQSLLENKLQLAIATDTCFADQIIRARVKVTEFKGQSNSYVAALFGRVLGPQTHYLLALGSDKKLILRKRINSTSTSATAIGSAVAFTTAPGQWYDVRFELIGSSLKGCVGDVCVSGTDSSIGSGGVAVGTLNTSARFDELEVTAP